MKIKLLLPALLLLVASFSGVSAQRIQLNSPEVKEVLKKNKSIVILDVRTAEEFAAGHLKGAQNMDIYQSDAYSKLDKLNPKTPYLVYCRTNHRSGMAVEYMMHKGFKTVYQMMDGFPGWVANNFAYEK
ncbi:MAG: rhodanese-like domain-containing protein [Bacteroidota bacterium]|nr:rhodanese-like domain-containing protein [Bacteroidota bacterium]